MLTWHYIDEERDDESFMRVERVSTLFLKYEDARN
jgi:hypothetical protein